VLLPYAGLVQMVLRAPVPAERLPAGYVCPDQYSSQDARPLHHTPVLSKRFRVCLATLGCS